MRPYVLALLLALPPMAWAQNAPEAGKGNAKTAPSPKTAQAPKPSSHARALSRALVSRQTWDHLLDRSAEGLSQAVSRTLATKGAKVPDGLQGNIRRELGQSLKYDETVETQAQALQERFSEQELDSAARFYGSPTGQKVLERLPEAQGEVGARLQQQLAMVVPEILHRVAPGALEPQGTGEGPPSPGEGGSESAPGSSDQARPDASPVPMGGGDSGRSP